MINFTQAFDSAWERMHVILFRPFDFGKWCAIGLSAFLAGFLQGGNGFNGSFNTNGLNDNTGLFPKSTSVQMPSFNLHTFNTSINQLLAGMQIGLIAVIVLLFMAFIFAFVLLLYWLGARGQFMFLDNLARNRAAIAWPWRYYARQANSLFLFYLLVIVVFMGVFLAVGGVALVLSIPLIKQHRWPVGDELIGYIFLGLIYFAVAVIVSVIMFVFREFGIPMMFRQGLLARPAFVASMRLIGQFPGTIALFVLLRIAIFLGVAVISIILCCATCCLALVPYVGTVMLLPVLVYVKCFSLDCLAQMAPEYNVWTVDVPAAGSPPSPPFSPPPRPG